MSVRLASTLPAYPGRVYALPLAATQTAPSAIAAAPVGPQVSRARVLQFSGQAMAGAGKNGVFVAIERSPCKVGGLGEVAKTVPAEIARHTDKDLRVFIPYLLQMKQEDEKMKAEGRTHFEFRKPDGSVDTYPLAFEETGLETQLLLPFKKLDELPSMQFETFKLLQRFEPLLDAQGQPIPREDNPNLPDGNWVYAIENENCFGRFNTPYPNKFHVDDLIGLGRTGDEAIFNLAATFSRATAAFLPALNASSSQGQNSKLRKFDGDAGFVIVNDWHTGPVLSELPEDYKAGKIFMLHNTYDAPRGHEEVEQNDLKVPAFMAQQTPDPQTGAPPVAVNPYTGQQRPYLTQQYSPLTIGLQEADAIIANRNYAETITKLGFTTGAPLAVQPLKEKLEADKVVDIHHAISASYTPYSNPILQQDGFTELKARDPEALKTFKAQNKLALQKMMGLRQDPNAVIFTWISRLDPYQKGFYMLMNEAERFLKTHKNAQLIIGGPNQDPKITAWSEHMQRVLAANPDLQDRFACQLKFVPAQQVVQMNAGSDFFLMPSVYEPYGLNQLEAYAMGAIPLVHGVDGLKTTVSDPQLRENHPEPDTHSEKVWNYGQTGVMMAPFNPVDYRRALEVHNVITHARQNILKGGRPNPGDAWAWSEYMLNYRWVLKRTQQEFRTALDRAMKLAEDPAALNQVRMNGMQYFETEHKWDNIVKNYSEAIDKAVAANQNRLEGSRLSAFA